MSIDLTVLGSKLKRYRDQFQINLDELSQVTGISEQKLSLFEEGKKSPSGDEILILADFYKCDYKFFISNERLASFEQTETLFRRFGNDFSKKDRWTVQEFLYLCECEEFLMKTLNDDERKSFDFIKEGSYFKDHGKNAAKALRKHLNYSSKEIGLNVYKDGRTIGVHIFRHKLGNSNISGLYVKHPVAGKCILINYSEDVYRQRFTVAHELAHTILDEENDFIVSHRRWNNDDLVEIRADTFASHFLMPEEFLKKIPESSNWNKEKVVNWANKLKVSTEALSIALKNAGLINNETERVIKSVKVPSEMKEDPELPFNMPSRLRENKKELLEAGLSSFYVKLCFDGYERGVISASRLAEMLLVRENRLKEIGELFGSSIQYGN